MRTDSPKHSKAEQIKEKQVIAEEYPSPSPAAPSIKSKTSKTKSMRKTVNKKSDRTGK